ncbi:MAG: DUF3488 domain-containing protein, partial [Deltaproteobacteria bacterium]|nr:DUF3488 domain-containing protein [Deltaproteobacteria bacterium]
MESSRTTGFTASREITLAGVILFYLALITPIAMNLAGGLGSIPLGLYILGWLGALVLPAGPAHKIPWTSMTVVFLAYVTANALLSHSLARGLAESASYLLLFLMASRLYQRRGTRSKFQLLLLTLAALTVVGGLTDEPVFAAVFLLYLPGAVLCLILMQVQEEPAGAGIPAGRNLNRECSFTALIATAGTLFLAMLLFFLVPRIGAGFFFSGRSLGPGMAGFGESMRIGDISSNSRSRRVLMRVEFPNRKGPPPPQFLYMKGAAFSRFDGSKWSVAVKGTRRLNGYGRAKGYKIGKPGPKPMMLEQLVSLEARLDVMPMADRAVSLSRQGPSDNFELHMLLFDSEGSVRPWRAGRNVLKYKVL